MPGKQLAPAGAAVLPSIERAQRWFEQGMKEHGLTKLAMQSVKEKALTAGWFFWHAKAACPHGQWHDFIESQKGISDRTVRSYIGFATDAIATVIGAEREFTDAQLKEYEPSPNDFSDKKYLEAAKRSVIHSSHGFVELCRELQLFRKFGEYDAVKSAAAAARAAKAGGPVQICFDFDVAMAGVRAAAAIDTAAISKIPTEKLPELRDQLRIALDKVEAQMKRVELPLEEVK